MRTAGGARSTPAGGQANEIELRLDRGARRWITSTLAGRGAGSEVWTYVIVHGPSDLEVVVDFFIPGTSGEKAARLFERYSALYAQLYDEDERMMVQREAALGRQRAQLVEAERAQDPATRLAVDLGPELQFTASLPRTVECAARAWRIVALASGPVVFAADCPHWLGPLSDAAVENDSDGAAFVRCPWHGYEFDVRTGACRTGQPCKLPTPPTLQLRDGRWWLEPGAAAAGGI